MKNLFKKSILFLLFFAVVFAIANVIFLALLVYTDEGFKKRLQSLRFDNPEYDLLVLGTSFAEYGMDTEYLTKQGIMSFNLASAGNSFETSYIQLDEYLKQYQRPPRYVLLAFNSQREQVEKYPIAPIVEVTMKDYKYRLSDAPIFRFTWLGTEMIKKVLSKKHRKASLVNGQVKFEKCSFDNTNLQEIDLKLDYAISRPWIGRIKELCLKYDIELILIEMPGFKETQNHNDIGPYNILLDNSLSVPLYNFNSQEFCRILDSKSDWIGNSHLNERGAQKFTAELLNIVKELNEGFK